MNLRYIAFASADPHFYDQVSTDTRNGSRSEGRFAPSAAVDWSRWYRGTTTKPWQYLAPPDHRLSEQGWKIHCSATAFNARDVLDTVSEYCGTHRIAFKFLRTVHDLTLANSKQAQRSASGKFITVYPDDDDATQRIAVDLDALVGGTDGPYVLSDLRWNRGPLYIRYGAYLPMMVTDSTGERVPAIRRPDGALEPDVRNPSFTPPTWLKIPDFVRAQMDTLSNGSVFPYTVREALHFSNSGGIYSAVDHAGNNVVVKEGRPFTAPDPDGNHAVERISHEYETLKHLAENPYSVSAVDLFDCEGHRFLVTERADGRSLHQEMALRYPLVSATHTRSSRIEYRDWALGIAGQLDLAVDGFHRAGTVHADLHPGNVICSEDGQIVVIDFEMAHSINKNPSRPLGAPGYTAPGGIKGVSADRYALGCMKLALFVPLTTLVALAPDKAAELIEYAVTRFELPARYRDSLHSLLGVDTHDSVRRETASAAAVENTITQLERGILDTLDLSRSDRLFPGDITQFTENGYSIAFGSCGNLLTTEFPHIVTQSVLDWTARQVDSSDTRQFGFFDGLAGAIHTFRQFGRTATADRWLATLIAVKPDELDSSLHSGLAGVGCLLLEESVTRPSTGTSDALAAVAEELRDRLATARSHVRETHGKLWAAKGRGGLMHGPSGQALFWMRHYEATRDHRSLEHARELIDIDLSVLRHCSDGSMQLAEERRTLPYVGSGSAGVGLALLHLMRYVEDPEYVTILHAIALSATTEFTTQSGFLNGRSGFVYFLAELARSPYAPSETVRHIEQQTDLMALHYVCHRGNLHLPGEHNLRLSTDWATGSAGALAAIRHSQLPGTDRAFPLISVPPHGSTSRIEHLSTDRSITTSIAQHAEALPTAP